MRHSLVLAALLALAAPAFAAAPARPAALSALDIISLEVAYTTVMARYYKPVEGATLLYGARAGLVAYLAKRGIKNPAIPRAPRNADRWSAESAIDSDVALAVARYGARVRVQDVVESTIAGELAALHDPYTVLFRAAEYKKFVAFLDGGKSAGIGAELDLDPQTRAVRVVDVFPGAPAELAGVRAGDVIAAIDGAPPNTATPDGVRLALQGTAGSSVRLTVLRDGTELAPLTIVRRAVSAPDVLARPLPGGIGYVRIRSFGARAPAEFKAALERLRATAPQAYIFDLRADGGGYRDAVIAIASHFVDGTIVTTTERAAPARVFAAHAAAKIDVPYALLVDGDTASAAEILAGAVQDRHTGTLVGTRTFGKGLVQETFPMPGGAAIKVTVASYRTPLGRDIEGAGITPDVAVPQAEGAQLGVPGHDAQLDRAAALLRKPSLPSL